MIPTKEKRRDPRTPCLEPIRISWEDQGQPCFAIAKCVDRSEAGVGIESLQPVRAGATILLGGERIKLSGAGVVRHVKRRGAKYLLGVQLTQAVLSKMLARKPS